MATEFLRRAAEAAMLVTVSCSCAAQDYDIVIMRTSFSFVPSGAGP